METMSPLILLVIPLAAVVGMAARRTLLWIFHTFPQHFAPRVDEAAVDHLVTHAAKVAVAGTLVAQKRGRLGYQTRRGDILIPAKEEHPTPQT